MDKRCILIGLFCLGWLLAAGCAPAVETEPLTATRAAIMPTVVTMATPLPSATTTMTPTPTPLSATEVWQTRAAHLTPLPLIPSATPTVAIPTPTFTPIPGPVSYILFAGAPCVTGNNICDDAVLLDQGLQWYQIASDGSGLRRVPQLENPELRIQDIRFSSDGSMMAYWAASDEQRHIFLADLHNNNPLELAAVPAEQGALLGGFDFMPGTDCLVLFWHADIQSSGSEQVSVEQICPNQPVSQVLQLIEFPDLRPGSSYSYLSPQGDAVLTTGRDRNSNWYLYNQELKVASPLHLLFFASSQNGMSLGPLYWQSDGQQVEFVVNLLRSNEASLTDYVVSRDGENIKIRRELTTTFVLVTGRWSENGREIVFFSGMMRDMPETTGIYIFDLEGGTWRQILSQFYLNRLPIWSPELP